MFRPMIPLLAAALLVACQEEPAEVMAKVADTSAAPRPLAARDQARQQLTEAGPTTALNRDTQADLQTAAAVVKLVPIKDQNAKLFGVAGGDPAINGMLSYIAFFAGSADGWRVYRLGDFETFNVLLVSRGRVELGITESGLDEATGEIGSATRRAIITWTPGVDGAAETNVAITPAR